MTIPFRAALILAAVLIQTASASTVLGNPTTGLQLQAGSATQVHELTVESCDAQTTVTIEVDLILQPTGTKQITLPEGEFCTMELAVTWPNANDSIKVGVTGFDELVLEVGEADLLISVNATNETAVLHYD